MGIATEDEEMEGYGGGEGEGEEEGEEEEAEEEEGSGRLGGQEKREGAHPLRRREERRKER
jgi:hypothetical protein